MENLTKNKAFEIHDNAKSYYERSQEYGYKFLMALKQIRDEKLFQDLGFFNFEEYTKENFGYSKNTINERIAAANEWGIDYDRARGQYGERKTRELAQLPSSERLAVIEKGINTNSGHKTVTEATTREIEEYRRRLKLAEADRDKARATSDKYAEQIIQMKTQPQKTVTKEVVKEVFPADYNEAIGSNLDLMERNKELVDRLDSVERSLKMKEAAYRLLEQETSEAIALKDSLEHLKADKQKLEASVANVFELSNLATEFETFFDEKMAPLRFKALIQGAGKEIQIDKIRQLLTLTENWLSEMNKIVPEKGRTIVEGEIVNE